MLLLPLSDAQGQTSLALGCLAMAGGMGRAPRRFAMMGLMREALVVGPMANAATTFTALPALRKATLIPPAHLDDTLPRAKRHLRLVHSRD